MNEFTPKCTDDQHDALYVAANKAKGEHVKVKAEDLRALLHDHQRLWQRRQMFNPGGAE